MRTIVWMRILIELKNSFGEIQYIGEKAFSCCDSLTDIEFKGNLKQIEDCAFEFCGSLVQIKLPEGLERIGKCTFYSCENLRSVELPESLVDIGNNAFYSCPNLQKVYYPKDKKAWKEVVVGIGNEDLQSAKMHFYCNSFFYRWHWKNEG